MLTLVFNFGFSVADLSSLRQIFGLYIRYLRNVLIKASFILIQV